MNKSKIIIFVTFLLINLLLISYYTDAGTLSVTIDSPSSGSSYSSGDSFTLTSTATCSGTGSNCNSVDLTATFDPGLSTSSSNPQSCGNINKDSSCTKSWTISTSSTGTKSITVTASSSNTASASSTISVTINAASVCGNSVLEGSEKCDGSAFGGKTCSSLGYQGGTLQCKSDCT